MTYYVNFQLKKSLIKTVKLPPVSDIATGYQRPIFRIQGEVSSFTVYLEMLTMYSRELVYCRIENDDVKERVTTTCGRENEFTTLFFSRNTEEGTMTLKAYERNVLEL